MSLIKWVLAFLVRRWMLIGAIAGVIASIAFVAQMMQPPKYAASSILLINPGQDRVLSQDQMVTGNDMLPASAIVESHIEVLTSPMMMGRLVDSLGLATPPAGTDTATDPLEIAQRRQSVINAVSGAIRVQRPRLELHREHHFRDREPAAFGRHGQQLGGTLSRLPARKPLPNG